MPDYYLQRVFADHEVATTALHLKARRQPFWDFENARFGDVALPYLSALPLIVVCLIAASHLLRAAPFASVLNRWRPQWTVPFVQEEDMRGGDGVSFRPPGNSIVWSIALTSLSLLVLATQIVKLLILPGLRLPAIFLLVSWTLVALVLALSRPRYCPPSLLAFYIPAAVAELAATKSLTYPPNLQNVAAHTATLLALISAAIILHMPLRPISPNSGPISKVGTTPKNTERSPEDALRLWQFLSVSWVRPLLLIGKERQIEKDDVWLLGYEFQNGRLARAFRQLQGSTVFRRLLKANGIDCCILVIISVVQLICEFASPLLFRQLLLAMENSKTRKGPALTYAVLLLVRGAVVAQFAALALWYSRRCYERSRGELIMMMYEKTMSRKIIVGSGKWEGKNSNKTANGNGSKNGVNGPSPSVATNGAPSDSVNGTSTGTSNGKQDQHGQSQTAKLKLFKGLFLGSPRTYVKHKGPATTGQILNLIRADANDVAQRFRDIEVIVKTPLGIIFAIWFIWSLFGASCLFAVMVVVIAELLNGSLARIQIRCYRFSKTAVDARIQINSQFIDVIRHLRWYDWQETWLAKVMAARQQELNSLAVIMMLNVLAHFITAFAQALFPVTVFFTYTALSGHQLQIDLIFPALELFSNLTSRLRRIPKLFKIFLSAYVAMERIEDFMNEPEKEEVSDSGANAAPSLVTAPPRLVGCSFAWPGTTTAILHDVNLVIEPGLTVIYGKIGSGKTALLQGFLGEMDQLSGDFEIPNEVMGYCSQTPWLQSVSIRDNILFFSPYDEERYQKILNSCALLPDLANFKDGDQSLIGENGVGLSGGQRARVALARAIYSRAKILLLDDPLSALDYHTAESIVRNCFSAVVAEGRTIILVTHRTSLVHHLATQFVEVSNGLVAVHSEDPFSTEESSSGHEEESNLQSAELESNQMKQDQPNSANQKENTNVIAQKQFLEEEHREHGGIKAKVWLTFIKAGKFWWILLFFMMAVTRVFNLAQYWFFKSWGEAYNEASVNLQNFTQAGNQIFHTERTLFKEVRVTQTFISLDPTDYLPSPNKNLRPWLIILLVISIGQSISLTMHVVSQLTAVYATIKTMFAQAITRVTYATFRFYDVTPVGRLMNRLTSDIQVLYNALNEFGRTVFDAGIFFTSFLVVALISPAFLLLSAALMGIFVFVFMQYLPASRSLKRLENVSLSPLYSIFGELLKDQGLTSVRAFRAQQAFEERVVTIVDQFQGLGHFYWSVQNWLLYRYENITAISTFTLTAVALALDLSPGIMAFMLINADKFMMSTHALCIRFGELQSQFVSVERIVELLEIEQEPEGTVEPPASWPRFGSEITFDNVTIRYAPHLDPSLTNISLHIPGGSTTAVIGRTGSGKSTLAAALLNIVRAESGVITVDNVALTDIKVKALRRRVTFVPQDPVLFPGTIRQNLDPIDEFTDDECNAVLSRVCDASTGQSWSLETNVESGGQNFSQGQRQLIGITRAVLRRSPVVILDEATASIDVATSMDLQRILREELQEATIITIAHRVEAVKGADYFVVLENGRVAREGRVEGDLAIDEAD